MSTYGQRYKFLLKLHTKKKEAFHFHAKSFPYCDEYLQENHPKVILYAIFISTIVHRLGCSPTHPRYSCKQGGSVRCHQQSS